MKKSVLAILFICLAGVSVTNANAAINDIDGDWIITGRTCTDGQPTNDNFELGKDTLQIILKKNTIRTILVAGNQIFMGNGTFTVSKNLITVTSSEGSVSTVGYAISVAGELVLVSADFGPGGTCNEKQALLSVFKIK